MQKLLKTGCLVVASITSVSCSTPTLTIKSEPSAASVFLQVANDPKKEIGKTPMEISYADLEKLVPATPVTGEMIPLTFEKETYAPTTLFVPTVRLGISSVTLVARLKTKSDEDRKADKTANGEPGSKDDRLLTADKLLQFLHNAQKFANGGDYARAIEEVNKAIEKDPNFIRALSMKGAIYFAQNRWDDSLIWYEKALALDNNFDEAVKMIAEIKKKNR